MKRPCHGTSVDRTRVSTCLVYFGGGLELNCSGFRACLGHLLTGCAVLNKCSVCRALVFWSLKWGFQYRLRRIFVRIK